MKTEPITNETILAEQPAGKYRVQVYRYFTGELVYRVLAKVRKSSYLEVWEKIRCHTDAQERSYPKHAAKIGTEMVKAVRREQPEYLAPDMAARHWIDRKVRSHVEQRGTSRTPLFDSATLDHEQQQAEGQLGLFTKPLTRPKALLE